MFLASDNFLRKWGSLTQWGRLEADCHIFRDLESSIGEMIGYSRVLLSHTISNGCTSSIPAITGRNALLICDTYVTCRRQLQWEPSIGAKFNFIADELNL